MRKEISSSGPGVSAQKDAAAGPSTRQHEVSGQESLEIAQPKAQQKTRNFARQLEDFDFDDMEINPYNEYDDPSSSSSFRAAARGFDPSKPESTWPPLRPSTPMENRYTGVILKPGQPTNLITPTYHYLYPGRTAATSSAHENVGKVLSADSRAAQQQMNTAAQKTAAQKAMDLERFRNTPQSSEGEQQTQCPTPNSLDASKATMPTTSQHQTSTFQELARKQGLREWDSNAIDDRWALRPEETWNTQSQTLSNLMAQRNSSKISDEKTSPHKSANEQATAFEEKLEQLSHDLKETHVKLQEMQHKDYKASLGSTSGDATIAVPPRRTLAEALAENEQVILEPSEPRLLRRYIRDLIIGNGTGNLPRGLPYEPDFIRQQFYKVVFGTLQPPPLTLEEENKLVKYNENITTYGEMRKSIFEEIDAAVRSMTRPLSRGPHGSPTTDNDTQDNSESVPERSSDGGSTTLPGSTNAPVDTRPSTASFSDHHQGDKPQEYLQSPSKLGEGLKDRLSPEGKSKSRMPFSRDKAHQGDNNAPSHTLPSANAQGHHNFATSTPVAQGRSAGAAPAHFSHGPVSFQPPANSLYGNYPMPQPWLFHAQQYNSYQAYGGVPPVQPGFAVPPYPYSNHGVAPASHPYSNFYTDRPTRPPASNRLAPLYANSPAFRPQGPTSQPRSDSIENRAEWQARRSNPASAQDGNRNSFLLPFRSGADDMYPRSRRGNSARFQNLTRNEPLQVSVALDEGNVPFGETAKLSKPADWGVLRISNIPYDITPLSITTFLGNHAKLITPDLGPAVHIIMDRSTGKTQDAFVEFFSTLDAKAWVSMIRSRPPQMNKIGDRILEVELSSQEELLKEIFPRAKSVIWRGGADGKQVIAQDSEDPFDSGFKGFITMEEIQSLVRHAEQPHRSIYTQKCPPRPYTGLISILTKFPWYATDLYTLSTRNVLFTATMAMVRHLLGLLRPTGPIVTADPSDHHGFHRHDYANISSPVAGISSKTFHSGPPSLARFAGQRHTHGLTESLLRDLVMAGLNAFGFSDKQRWEIHQTAAPILGKEMFRLSEMARGWPFETLGRKRGYEEDVIQIYAHLISSHPMVSNATRSTVLRSPYVPFGSLESFYYLLDLNITTLAQMAKHEKKVLATLITEMCAYQANSANLNSVRET